LAPGTVAYDYDTRDRLLTETLGSNPAAVSTYDESGNRRKDLTAFWVPNEYVANVAKTRPDRFEWTASIHPYRADAVAALESARREGARAVKWLPNAMGIHPGSPRCDAFYRKLAELKMPLFTHAGEEQAVERRGLEARVSGGERIEDLARRRHHGARGDSRRRPCSPATVVILLVPKPARTAAAVANSGRGCAAR
jgi:predicted TIM-barrel fold metal-dependent hydrolase